MNSNPFPHSSEPLFSSEIFATSSNSLPQTPQSIDQIFEDASTKLSNSEESHNTITSFIQDPKLNQQHNLIDHFQKKKETNFKHMLNIHQIADIIPGKRTRKPPETFAAAKGNNQQNLPGKNLPRPVGRPSKKHIPMLNITNIRLSKTPGRKASAPHDYSKIIESSHSELTSPHPSTRSSRRKMSYASVGKESNGTPVKKVAIERSVLVPTTKKESAKKVIEDEEPEPEVEDEDEDEVATVKNIDEVPKIGTPRIKLKPKKFGSPIKRQNSRLTSKFTKPKQKEEKTDKDNEDQPKKIVREVAMKEFSVEIYLKTEEAVVELNKEFQRVGTYINCDLRYFNFDFLVDKLGSFDIIVMDPPWRIKGAQQNDSSFMFSNSKFNLEYDTLSNQEIMNLKVERLSKKGFIFLWILSNQINTAYEMLNKWGYEVVDQLVWVKLKDSKIYLSHGYYFMHSFEMCLIGYKCPPGESIEYTAKISNDVLFGEVRTKSRKPDELYELAEILMPGSRKIELFARNHNLRPGWMSLGNQLGENFEKWYNIVQCNSCNQPIYIGIKRFKSRHKTDYDLCEKCFVDQNLKKDDFFEMNNMVNEDVLHHYHSCNHCLTEPIWGSRFSCLDCENFDLCECCYDKNLRTDRKFHDVYHNFKVVEVPILGHGLPAHSDKKCSYCFQKPILGVCFSCTQCTNLNFCQNCFFSKPHDEMKKFRGHKSHHNFQIQAEPVQVETRLHKCSCCEICPIQGTAYKCENCFSFYFCEKCYGKRDTFKPNTANTHKFYHTFVQVDDTAAAE